MRCLIFFPAEITLLAGLLRRQAQVPHYSSRKKIKHLITSSEKNEAPP